MAVPPEAAGATTARSSAPGASRRKVIVGASIGHVLEWYDWVIYLVLSPFFAAQFLGEADPVAAQLGSFAVFAVGFVMRPVGGLFFGWLADRRGRRTSMTTAMVVTAASTLLLAIAPTYDQVGTAAAVLLMVARLGQGFGLGGEVSGAYTYLAEMAPPRRRGLWSSSMYVAVTVGVTLATVLAAVLLSILGEDTMASWGWRLPFVLGALLGLYAFYLRRSLEETRAFRSVRATERATGSAASTAAGVAGATLSIPRAIWQNWGAVLRVLTMTVAPSVTYYLWSVAAPSYAITVKGVDAQQALWVGVAANLVFIALLPPWGRLSDRWGRRPNMIIFSVGMAVLVFPLNALIADRAWQLGVAMAIALTVQGAFASIGPALYAEQFPARVRASGFALPYSTGWPCSVAPRRTCRPSSPAGGWAWCSRSTSSCCWPSASRRRCSCGRPRASRSTDLSAGASGVSGVAHGLRTHPC